MADMLLVKVLLNSVVSTLNGKFMCVNISIFYLNTLLPWYKYLRLKLGSIPQEVIDKYKLLEKTKAYGYVYTKVDKGMHGPPQAGLISQDLLEKDWM